MCPLCTFSPSRSRVRLMFLCNSDWLGKVFFFMFSKPYAWAGARIKYTYYYVANKLLCGWQKTDVCAHTCIVSVVCVYRLFAHFIHIFHHIRVWLLANKRAKFSHLGRLSYIRTMNINGRTDEIYWCDG